MALGLNLSSASSDDIIPIIKYDARGGRISRRDYNGGDVETHDITNNFKAVFDFENLEVGSIDFSTGGAPSFVMARYGSPIPQAPNGDHKPGARLLVKLVGESGNDVRELASTAKAFLKGLDVLHNAYLTGVKENPGKLPLVEMQGVTQLSTGSGDRKSTNYMPNFVITKWGARPADLVYTPRGGQPEQSASSSSPPSTGSTKVSAPPAADDDDFG